MEALILAAGLGTRLRPLTNNRPKALVEIDGHTLLEINLLRLIQAGATRIVVNVHHFADQITDFIASHHWDTEVLISDEREQLLDTGGALKHATSLFSGHDSIMVHNVDILSSINLRDIINQHSHSMSFATLVVSQRNTSRQLLFDSYDKLAGWCNNTTGEHLWVEHPIENTKSLAFSGITVIQPSLLELLPDDATPYPIIPEYLRIAKNHTISYFEHTANNWMDVGKPETLSAAASFLNL